jgi:hypothetical protein
MHAGHRIRASGLQKTALFKDYCFKSANLDFVCSKTPE